MVWNLSFTNDLNSCLLTNNFITKHTWKLPVQSNPNFWPLSSFSEQLRDQGLAQKQNLSGSNSAFLSLSFCHLPHPDYPAGLWIKSGLA